MEWGIGGLKRKMEMIDEKVSVTKLKYTHLFIATIIFTNYLYKPLTINHNLQLVFMTIF
jgi:hypothetical protein